MQQGLEERVQVRETGLIAGRTIRLLQRFQSVRGATMALAAPLSAEDCAIQSMPDASPVKWHLAHTTWFFETFVLEEHLSGYRPYNPAFRVLFNSYYNAVGDKHPRPERGMLSRPSLEDILAYRTHVDAAVRNLLGDAEVAIDCADLIELGLHHEQQHQELILTDIKHLFSLNPLRPAYVAAPLLPGRASAPQWIDFDGGLYEIGHAAEGFAFDNESPRHRAWLEPFRLASHPVSNGDFLDFIADGGYRRPELWLSAGWDVVAAHGWQAPLYWRQYGGQWHMFTLHGEQPVFRDAPVAHISFFEADAFARWADARLPTEIEWETAVRGPVAGNFVESGIFHPRSTDTPTDGRIHQAFGDVWEWTRSEYAPYPGFQASSDALGEYNGKFMCSQYVLRGGSCVTPQDHIRPTYRNFFPPDARWQFSGLRLARDA